MSEWANGQSRTNGVAAEVQRMGKSNDQAPPDIARDIAQATKGMPILFLCGAGVSVGSPSNVPAAADVVRALAGVYWEHPAVRRSWANDEPAFRRWLGGVWFERVVSAIPGKSLDGFLQLFRSEAPTVLHQVLAASIRDRGDFVATVNFDNGIELAEPSLIPVVDPSDFETVHLSLVGRNDARLLLKLHGSIERPGSVQALLRDVQSSGRAFAFHPGKRQALQALLKRCLLVVVGYSASDIVDVWPLLHESTVRSKVWWCVYEANVPLQVLRTSYEPIEHLCSKHVRGFLHDRAATVIHGDPTPVFEALAQQLGLSLKASAAPHPQGDRGLSVREGLEAALFHDPGDRDARPPVMVARTVLLDSVGHGVQDPRQLERAADLARASRASYSQQRRFQGVILATGTAATALDYAEQPVAAALEYQTCVEEIDLPSVLLDMFRVLEQAGQAFWRLAVVSNREAKDEVARKARSLLQAALLLAKAVRECGSLIAFRGAGRDVPGEARAAFLDAATDLLPVAGHFGGPGALKDALRLVEEASLPATGVSDLSWVFAARAMLAHEEGDPIGSLAYGVTALEECESGALPSRVQLGLKALVQEATEVVTVRRPVFLRRGELAAANRDWFGTYAYLATFRREPEPDDPPEALEHARLLFEESLSELRAPFST